VDRLRDAVAPMLLGRAFTITADVVIPANGANGVIVAQGGRYGGFSLFVKNNRVFYEMNAFGNRAGQIVSSDPLTAGKTQIVLKLVPDSVKKVELFEDPEVASQPGTGTLSIDGKPEGVGRFANVNGRSRETFDVGSDLGSAVSQEYQSPDRFTGKIDRVTIQLN
jgi:arylsulfatase